MTPMSSADLMVPPIQPRPLIPDPLYYLRNFETALRGLECRGGDLPWGRDEATAAAAVLAIPVNDLTAIDLLNRDFSFTQWTRAKSVDDKTTRPRT
jgi:hypothetical protein